MEHGPGRVRMGTRRGTLSFIELPVDTGRRGYMICVPINIGCCCRRQRRPPPPRDDLANHRGLARPRRQPHLASRSRHRQGDACARHEHRRRAARVQQLPGAGPPSVLYVGRGGAGAPLASRFRLRLWQRSLRAQLLPTNGGHRALQRPHVRRLRPSLHRRLAPAGLPSGGAKRTTLSRRIAQGHRHPTGCV